MNYQEQVSLNAVTVDTTGTPVNIEPYKRVGFQLIAASITSGNGVFTFEGTIDGKTWTALNVLIDNVTNTNAQNLTLVASKTLSSNTSVLVWLAPFAALKAVRVKVDMTTDGAYSAYVIGNN